MVMAGYSNSSYGLGRYLSIALVETVDAVRRVVQL